MDTEDQEYTFGNSHALAVFERADGEAPLTPIVEEPIKQGATVFGSLAMQQVDDVYWMYTQLPVVWRWDSEESQATHSEPEDYAEGRGEYSSGAQSKVDPTVLLAGSDGGAHGINRLEGSTPAFELMPNTSEGEHKLGLWVRDTWVTDSGTEMWVAGGAGENWRLQEAEFQDSDIQITSWDIPVGWELGTHNGRDSFGYNPRSYSTSVVDPDSDLVALFRSESRGGTVLTTRTAIETAARATDGWPVETDTLQEILPTALTELVLHPEAPMDGTDWPNETRDHLFGFHGRFFTETTGSRSLGVAAGYHVDPESDDYRRPKAVFYDLEGFQPEQDVPQAVLLGSDGPGMAIDVEIFWQNDRQLAVMADSSGSVSLHDLTRLNEVYTGLADPSVLEPLATWTMAPRTLDGYTTVCSDVLVRREKVDDQWVQRIYVAGNRAGVFVLQVTESDSQLKLEEIEEDHINTIYQALSLSLETVDGQELLVVYDHGGGIAAFGSQ